MKQVERELLAEGENGIRELMAEDGAVFVRRAQCRQGTILWFSHHPHFGGDCAVHLTVKRRRGTDLHLDISIRGGGDSDFIPPGPNSPNPIALGETAGRHGGDPGKRLNP